MVEPRYYEGSQRVSTDFGLTLVALNGKQNTESERTLGDATCCIFGQTAICLTIDASIGIQSSQAARRPEYGLICSRQYNSTTVPAFLAISIAGAKSLSLANNTALWI